MQIYVTLKNKCFHCISTVVRDIFWASICHAVCQIYNRLWSWRLTPFYCYGCRQKISDTPLAGFRIPWSYGRPARPWQYSHDSISNLVELCKFFRYYYCAFDSSCCLQFCTTIANEFYPPLTIGTKGNQYSQFFQVACKARFHWLHQWSLSHLWSLLIKFHPQTIWLKNYKRKTF